MEYVKDDICRTYKWDVMKESYFNQLLPFKCSEILVLVELSKVGTGTGTATVIKVQT
jgi:hypothetical protein